MEDQEDPTFVTFETAKSKVQDKARKSILVSFVVGAVLATVLGAVVRGETGIWTAHGNGENIAHIEDNGRELSIADRHPNVGWDCEDGGYHGRTLKLAYEESFHSLFPFYERYYEASSVVLSTDKKTAYAVMDSSWSLYKFGVDLKRRSDDNIRYGDPEREAGIESGYEAIFKSHGLFYIVRESVLHDETQTYHAVIEEVRLNARGDTSTTEQFQLLRKCSTEFEFESGSKGFEGVWAIHDYDKEFYLLALCEGNRCSEKNRMNPGNGRIVILKLNETETDCKWQTYGQLDLPKSAYFNDYSAMSIRDDGYVAITSQEDSQLWIGRMFGKDPHSNLWNVSELAFDEVGELFSFPKNENCETIYCNIEGIHWLDSGTLLAVSDKTHGEGKEDYRCHAKDQSVHVFVLP